MIPRNSDSLGTPATPLKSRNHPLESFGVETPCGSLLYNPFQRELISRISRPTFSPGLFTVDKSPSSNSDVHTPRFASNGFLSPQDQGDLFPVEIDENHASQLKLQENYEHHSTNEMLQKSIENYFQSSVIVPSPAGIEPRAPGSLFRTSSMLPNLTPKGVNRKKLQPLKPEAIGIRLSHAETQTAISLPLDFDLMGLLEREAKSNTGINLNACCSSSQSTGSVPLASSSFVCLSCRQTNSEDRFTKRSLFVQPLDAIADNSQSEAPLLQAPPIFRRINNNGTQENLVSDLALPPKFGLGSDSDSGDEGKKSDEVVSPIRACERLDMSCQQADTSASKFNTITPASNLFCLSLGRTSPSVNEQPLESFFTIDVSPIAGSHPPCDEMDS